MKKPMRSWQLEVGLYPGILFGIRTYVEKDFKEYVLYIPFAELCLTVYEDE
jgi:hypothetical protein